MEKKYLFLSINVNYDYYLRALKKTEKNKNFSNFSLIDISGSQAFCSVDMKLIIWSEW